MDIAMMVDGGFFDAVSRYYKFERNKSRLSLSGFSRYVKMRIAEHFKTGCRITESHYFRGRMSTDSLLDNGKLEADRRFVDVVIKEGFTPHFYPMDEGSGRLKEKGVDVGLALESYDIAARGKVGVVALVAGDGDYAPLVTKLRAMGVFVVVTVWNCHFTQGSGQESSIFTSKELRARADMLVHLEEGLSMEPEETESLVFVHGTDSRELEEGDEG